MFIDNVNNRFWYSRKKKIKATIQDRAEWKQVWLMFYRKRRGIKLDSFSFMYWRVVTKAVSFSHAFVVINLNTIRTGRSRANQCSASTTGENHQGVVTASDARG